MRKARIYKLEETWVFKSPSGVCYHYRTFRYAMKAATTERKPPMDTNYISPWVYMERCHKINKAIEDFICEYAPINQREFDLIQYIQSIARGYCDG